MLRVRFSLFTKIMLWFFLNLLLLALVLIFAFNSEIRFSPRFSTSNRLESIGRLIAYETQDKTRAESDSIMAQYSQTYGVEFFIFDDSAKQLAGRQIVLPPEVLQKITRMQMPGPPPIQRGNPNDLPPFGPPGPDGNGPPSPHFFVWSSDPPLYWAGTPMFIFAKDNPEAQRARFIAASTSMSGNGLFFDPTPWIILGLVIFAGSTLFWLPFVRNITKSIRQLSGATEQIAEENFDIRVNEKRTDELGRLGKAINHMAGRLSGFVGGQKRFLGDVSHELNSPLARMQFALSILEDRVTDENRAYVQDVQEEVEVMTKLVGELLTYSKAGIRSRDVALEPVVLLPLIEQVIARETANESVEISVDIDSDVKVLAQPELLVRAVGNVVRNALRYAGDAGPIAISVKQIDGDQVNLTIADNGPGVPETELEKLFDPFYRLETHRARETGGSGLGLAIVKTCVETCGGKVSAQNRQPSGLQINILLKSA
jgi:two-component system sensor histidine kinase CpxA